MTAAQSIRSTTSKGNTMTDLIADIAAGRVALPGHTESESYPTPGGGRTGWRGTPSSTVGVIDCCGPDMWGTREQAQAHAKKCRE